MHADWLCMTVLLLIVVFCVCTLGANNSPYDTIVSFGDSNSDTGNVFNLTGSRWPPSPYYLGRFSNGPVWVEQLGISNLINYAYGSATTDNNLVTGITQYNTVVPGVRQQIVMYQNNTDLTKVNFARTIYVVWVGGNDYYFNLTLSPSTVVNSLINGINDLIRIGAKYLLILNQPPLQAYPALLGANMDSYLSAITLQHNANLSNSIQMLQSNFSNIKFYLSDVYSLINNILINGSLYGINNTNNCWYTLNSSVIPLCTNPNNYLFIDEYHFTTHVHQLIADQAQKLFSTSKGIIQSPFSVVFYIIIYSVIYN